MYVGVLISSILINRFHCSHSTVVHMYIYSAVLSLTRAYGFYVNKNITKHDKLGNTVSEIKQHVCRFTLCLYVFMLSI